MENIIDLYKGGMSIPEVSKSTGISKSTVRLRLKDAGVLRSRSDAIRLSSDQGKLGLGNKGKTRVFSEAHKANISTARKEWSENNAIGFSLKPNGYFEYTTGENKGRLVHVVEMEKRIGRRLMDDECVHHIDGCKQNNDINNLALMTRSAHTRLHRFEDSLSGRHREREENGRFS